MTNPINGSDPCGGVRSCQSSEASRPRPANARGGQPPLPPIPPTSPYPELEPTSLASSGQLKQLARAQEPPSLEDAGRLARARERLEQGWFHTREGVDAMASSLLEQGITEA